MVQHSFIFDNDKRHVVVRNSAGAAAAKQPFCHNRIYYVTKKLNFLNKIFVVLHVTSFADNRQNFMWSEKWFKTSRDPSLEKFFEENSANLGTLNL